MTATTTPAVPMSPSAGTSPAAAPVPAPAPLSYATPGATDAGGRSYVVLALALAVGLGFLGANAFADAAGFPVPRDHRGDEGYVMLRVLCGIVVAAVSFALLTFLFREARAVVAALARAGERPGPTIALASLVCGTACVLAALGVQLYTMRHPNLVVGPDGARFHTPLMAQIITLFGFLTGVALIAAGIWSSMGRTAQPPRGA